MAFEIKYDRDGNPIRNAEMQEQVNQPTPEVQEQPEVYENTPQEQPEVEDAYEHEHTEDHDHEEAEEEVVTKKETEQQQNFRQLKEAKRQSDREREEAVRRYEEMKKQYDARNKAPEVEEEDDFDLANDDLAEGKHLRALNAKHKKLMAQVREQERVSKEQQQIYQQNLMNTKLNAQYPDLNKVVSEENIERLKKMYPEVAHSIGANTDYYSQAVSAYTVIKNLGIYKDDSFIADKIKAQANSNKPRAMNSISPQKGNSAMANAHEFANGLTPALKEQLRREMESIRKNS